MRKLTAGLAIATILSAATAQAALASDTEIAFPDIVSTLATKVDMHSDLAFFETQVLQGKAERRPGPPGGDGTNLTFSYAYDPAVSSAEYSEVKSGNAVMITFSAYSFAPAPCLTFTQAQATLASQGWTLTDRSNTGDIIREAYYRNFVTLDISNIDVLPPPILESWNTTETNDNLMAQHETAAAALKAQRSQLAPDTTAYDALCVTVIGVKLAH